MINRIKKGQWKNIKVGKTIFQQVPLDNKRSNDSILMGFMRLATSLIASKHLKPPNNMVCSFSTLETSPLL